MQASSRLPYKNLAATGAAEGTHGPIFTSDEGGGTCFCPCLFVCLSVSKTTQKRVHGFG